MSEAVWRGIALAEVTGAKLRNIWNGLRTVRRLVTSGGIDYTFDTSESGGVIDSDNYLAWEFIAPDGFAVDPGETVGDFFDNLYAAEQLDSVQDWDDFAVFVGENADMINSELSPPTQATVTLAAGTSYAATINQVTAFANFADMVLWFKGCMSAAALAADSEEAFSGGTVAFSLTAEDTTISFVFR